MVTTIDMQAYGVIYHETGHFLFNNVLNKELKKYIEMICKNDKREVTSSCTYLSLEGGKNC